MLIGIKDLALLNITRVDSFSLFHSPIKEKKVKKGGGFLGLFDLEETIEVDSYNATLVYRDMDGKQQQFGWRCANYDLMKSHLKELISQLKRHDLDLISEALEKAMMAEPEEKK